MIKVILAEDHEIVRDGIKMLLEKDAKLQIVGEADNGQEVLDIIEAGQEVDVVLADIHMPEMDGMALIKALKEVHPMVSIIILSMLDNEKYVAQAFAQGASGYLLKTVTADELVFSLKHVNAGGRYLCSELSIRLMDERFNPARHPDLLNKDAADFSLREIEILHLLSEGHTNQEIADKLFISKRTVEGHRQNMIDKLGVRNTAALIRYAVLKGLVY